MRLSSLSATFLCLFSLANAQDWSLAGKVVDAEEGNGLGSVTVELAKAGLRTTTTKKGVWSLGAGVGVRILPHTSLPTANSLRVDQGRLHLLLDGVDILGRGAPNLASLPYSARAMASAVTDTLVYTREGYVIKRVALKTNSLTNILDSIRRIRGNEWVDSSHSNGPKPDTTDAFVDTLRQITFRFSRPAWDRMMKTMADTCGKFGSSPNGGFGASTNCQASQYDLIKASALIWVPVDLVTDGQVWKNVGIRLKGNASLMTSWTRGSYSLPFRINTDKYEDSFPTIKNQRFHGFKKLSFYNLEQDTSGVRGAVAGEVFRQAGIVTPISVPVRIKLDRGDNAPLDVGIYEMLEVPDSPLLNRYFDNDSGNLYKPLAKLNQYADSEWVDEDVNSDYSDAKAFVTAINAPSHTTDHAAWRAGLEKVFDVKGFTKWLAVSTAIMNWDAYGTLAHNYFLFNDRGVFRWITYDFGWSFDYAMNLLPASTVWYDKSGGFQNYGPFPLIDNLLADPVYCEEYRKQMVAAIAADGPAGAKSVQEKVERYGRMVASQASTTAAVAKLRNFMTPRIAEINKSLASKTCPTGK